MRVVGTSGKPATTRRGKKVLIKRAPKIRENDKKALIIHGNKTTPVIREVMEYLYNLKKPLAMHMRWHHPYHLFEDVTAVEGFAKKYDSSLFLFGTNQKKRPNTLIFGRMYDHQLLDMFELRVTNYVPASEFKQPAPLYGCKPCLVLQGTLFESDDEMKRLGNLMVDWFRGPKVPQIRLQGLETIITFTAVENKLLFRVYRTQLKKSATKTPRVELVECGPSIDFALDRKQLASDSLYKTATKVPAQLRIKPKKNVSQDVFGTTHARIHLGRQDVGRIQTRKVKALKKNTATGSNAIPVNYAPGESMEE